MTYSIHLDIAALIISGIVMVHFIYKKTINTHQTRLFHLVLRMSIFATVLDIVSSIAIGFYQNVPPALNYLLSFSYFFAFNCVMALYYQYLLTAIKSSVQYTKKEKTNLLFPTILTLLVLLPNYWTKWAFYFDDAGVYHSTPLMILLYGFPMLYIGMSLWYTFKYNEKVTPMLRASVYFFAFASIIASLLQMKYPNLLISGFVISTSLLLIYLSLENPENYEDKQLGTYNYMAFVETLRTKFEKNQHFEVLVIEVQGLQYLNETFGVNCETALLKQVASFLTLRSKDLQLFNLRRNQFALVGCMKKNIWDLILADIRHRFKHSFVYNGADIMLSAVYSMTSYPESVESLEDTLDIIDYSLQEAKKYGSEKTMYAKKDNLTEGKRENEVLRVIKQALVENRFEVYYQPIYSANEKCFTAAEALIRLKDDKLGFISPDEFIPIAEQNGLIIEIGECVFRKVCQFMSQVKIWEKGIQYIDVNLSVIQCMQERLHNVLLEIMDEYNIEYHYITLEVTETVASFSNEVVRTNMEHLIDKGMHISLDDYGTGFSNTATLVQYPFSTIKLDKSMLWTAMDNEKAMSALKHVIAMIRDMNMMVICEGVETLEQADLLVESGCAYHQGYYYSKPLSAQMFLEKIDS